MTSSFSVLISRSVLTYIVLGLIGIGGIFAAIEPRFGPLYSTFVWGVVTVKGSLHVANLGSEYLGNQGNQTVNINNDIQSIVPSAPTPIQPIGSIND